MTRERVSRSLPVPYPPCDPPPTACTPAPCRAFPARVSPVADGERKAGGRSKVRTTRHRETACSRTRRIFSRWAYSNGHTAPALGAFETDNRRFLQSLKRRASQTFGGSFGGNTETSGTRARLQSTSCAVCWIAPATTPRPASCGSFYLQQQWRIATRRGSRTRRLRS